MTVMAKSTVLMTLLADVRRVQELWTGAVATPARSSAVQAEWPELVNRLDALGRNHAATVSMVDDVRSLVRQVQRLREERDAAVTVAAESARSTLTKSALGLAVPSITDLLGVSVPEWTPNYRIQMMVTDAIKTLLEERSEAVGIIASLHAFDSVPDDHHGYVGSPLDKRVRAFLARVNAS